MPKPKKVGGLEKLLIEELQGLFDAEKQLVRALPKMAKSATDQELENALREHLEVTKGQVQRLEQVFEIMDMRARSRPCNGMKGIVEEGQEKLSEDFGDGILDSAITGSARKVEHYEIAGYETVRSAARQLGMKEAADLLEQTLREEVDADKKLAQISKQLFKSAVAGKPEEIEERRQPAGRLRSRTAQRAPAETASRRTGRSAHALTNHEEIQAWAEDRGARPSCVRGTGGGEDVGMIRLDFPGYSGEESLEEISWDDWFDKFDQSNLALMVQETTSGGQKSNFNKIVSRESIEQRPKVRSAR